MEYTVNHLAKLSGVSTRTLRYYDKIGLLKPLQVNSNGYRIYGDEQINLLQQILFYRDLDFCLEDIKSIVTAPDFDREQALADHLVMLEARRQQMELLIQNVKKTIASMKGETVMNDAEKFEGFKKDFIKENEETYGQEIRNRYGDKTVDASNARLAGMTQDQWNETKQLEETIATLLVQAIQTGSPSSPIAQKLCETHKTWLTMFWPDNTYTKEGHLALAESYVADARFKAYYDNIIEGGAEFLRNALAVYCS